MTMTSVDLDPQPIERARALTGERSNRAVIDVALRRLIASKQKGSMIDGIAELDGLQAELGAPGCAPSTSTPSPTTQPCSPQTATMTTSVRAFVMRL